MSTQLPSLLDRTELRTFYDQAVEEINATRDTKLNSAFHAQISDAVFEAGVTALLDSVTKTKRMHTLSAPPGAGKTSFSCAFIAAFTRYAEVHADCPYGAVYVVDQISRANEVFKELDALLPGKVAVWYTDHPSDRAGLKFFPVAVCTHNFFVDVNGHHARNVDRYRDGRFRQRALTMVDEQPEDVKTYEVTVAEAHAVREALNENYPDVKEHLNNLFRFIDPFSYTPANHIYRPGIEIDLNAVSTQLAWFARDEAKRIEHSAAGKQIDGVGRLFGFARAMSIGCGFVVSGNPVRFVGWESKIIAKLNAGTILLDATADIDGISRLVPWRVDTVVPQACYANLEIVHVPQLTTQRLNVYLKTAPNQHAYVDWMKKVIVDQTDAGDRVLVVCNKKLFENERVPDWPERDERFKDPDSYNKRYEWDVEGRKVCATHWGKGVGSNDWRDADTVILFEEFYIPRRAHAAKAQGLLELKAHEGPLGSMRTLNSISPGVDALDLGHRLRWLKQMALRGKGRKYDENGMCGKQKLVVACALQGFLANVGTVFPGAPVHLTDGDGGTLFEKVLQHLNSEATRTVITTAEIEKVIKRKWRKVSPKLITQAFFSALAGIGWRYVSRKGRSGCYFEKTPNEALAA